MEGSTAYSWGGRLFAPILCGVLLFKLTVASDAGGMDLPFAALMAGCLALTVVFGREPSRWLIPAPGPMDVALALLVCVEIIVYARSSYRPNSFFSLREAAFLPLLFCFAKSYLGEETRRRRFLVWMTGLAALWACAGAVRCMRGLSALYALGIDDLTAFKQYFSYGSWATQAILLLPYPLSLAAGARNQPRPRRLSAAVALALCAVFLFSFSRGAYAALAVFILVAGTGYAACKVVTLRQLLFACALLAGVLALAAVPVRQSVSTTVALFETTSQTRSFTARRQLYSRSLHAVENAPDFGIGSSNYPLYSMSKGSEDESGGDGDYLNTPLNRFVATMIEKGVAGLAAHIGVLIVFFAMSLWSLRKRGQTFRPYEDVSHGAVLVSCVAAIAAAAVHQMSYYPAHGNAGTAALEWVAYAVASARLMKL